MKDRKNRRELPSVIIFILFVFSFAAIFIFSPKKEYSENEKRVLSDAPVFNIESVKSGKFAEDSEKYISDHFPMRDGFVGINSYFSLLTGKSCENGIYKAADGYLLAAPSDYSEERLNKNIEEINRFAENCKLKATLLAVPTAGYMLEDKLPQLHKKYNDGEIVKILTEKCTVPSPDIAAYFNTVSDDDIYYKTDHHLTSRGALYLYEKFCDLNGSAPCEFTLSETYDGFYGTAYSKSGLWLQKPDKIEIFKAKSKDDFTVDIYDGDKKTTADSLYFPAHLKNADKYPVFLDGNHSLVTIKNNNCKNGKRILIIKDSFAHCFTTYLARDYEEAVMVDMRYYRKNVYDLISEYDLNELLFIYGTENLASSTDIPWLNMYL